MSRSSRVLVVEDSRFFRVLVRDGIAKRIPAEVVAVETLADTMAAVATEEQAFDFALVDLVLPDAPNGEAADFLLQQRIPCVVFTGMFSEPMRERLLAQKVVDYVVKDTPASLDYLMDLVEQLHSNYDRKVLVVDDSQHTRRYIVDQLQNYRLRTLEAVDGEDGLRVLAANPDVQLVITDFHMPKMNGVEMVRRMRALHGRDGLAIIGVSSGGGSALSANFIKHGANDYLNKPFLREEFFCRVMQNLRMLDMVTRLREMSIHDELTDMHNRRYLFEVGESMYASAARGKIGLTVGVLDVDHFKAVNDTYGHDCGDYVLQEVAKLLKEVCRKTDVVARLGGEEFAIFAVDVQDESVPAFFENIRRQLEALSLRWKGKDLAIAASFGVCHGVRNSLQEMMSEADRMLYVAKSNGRNRVEIS